MLNFPLFFLSRASQPAALQSYKCERYMGIVSLVRMSAGQAPIGQTVKLLSVLQVQGTVLVPAPLAEHVVFAIKREDAAMSSYITDSLGCVADSLQLSDALKEDCMTVQCAVSAQDLVSRCFKSLVLGFLRPIGFLSKPLMFFF